MKRFNAWTGCLLLSLLIVACDDEPDEADQEIEEPTVEETDEALEEEEEDDPEAIAAAVDEFVDAYAEECREVICSRAIECHEQLDEPEVDPPGFTVDECYEQNCTTPDELRQQFYEATESVDHAERCGEAALEIASCLRQLSCEELVAWVHPDLESDQDCEQEFAAQDEACGPLVEIDRNYRQQQQADTEETDEQDE